MTIGKFYNLMRLSAGADPALISSALSECGNPLEIASLARALGCANNVHAVAYALTKCDKYVEPIIIAAV